MDVEVQFLLDESDTVLAYENQGRTEPFGEDLLMSFLGSMDHVQQLEMIYREHGEGRGEDVGSKT